MPRSRKHFSGGGPPVLPDVAPEIASSALAASLSAALFASSRKPMTLLPISRLVPRCRAEEPTHHHARLIGCCTPADHHMTEVTNACPRLSVQRLQGDHRCRPVRLAEQEDAQDPDGLRTRLGEDRLDGRLPG